MFDNTFDNSGTLILVSDNQEKPSTEQAILYLILPIQTISRYIRVNILGGKNWEDSDSIAYEMTKNIFSILMVSKR